MRDVVDYDTPKSKGAMKFSFVMIFLLSVSIAHSQSSCTNEEFAKKISKNLPDGLESLIVRITECGHWGGEEPYDKERAAFIEAAVKKANCDKIDKDKEALVKKNPKKIKELKNAFVAADRWDEGSCE